MFWFVQNCVLLSIGASIESAKLSLLVCSGDLRAKSGNCKPLATSLKSNHRQLQYISQQHKTLKPRGTEKKQLLISSYHFTVIEEPLQLMSGCFPINFLKLFFCFSSFYGGVNRFRRQTNVDDTHAKTQQSGNIMKRSAP